MEHRNIAYFDCESTGLNTETDRIVQIAVCITDHLLNIVAGPFETLVNPEMEIPADATEIHGITNKMVANAPKFKDIALATLQMFDPCDLGGYNLKTFDVPLLINEFNRAGVNFSIKDRKIVDNCLVFKRKEGRSLSDAVKFYTGKEMEDAHDAKADIMATIEVARGQINHYEDITTVDDLIAVTEPENTCDLAGKIVMKKGVPIFNFGPKFGEPIRDNMGLLDWMLSKDFAKETKDWIEDYISKNKE